MKSSGQSTGQRLFAFIGVSVIGVLAIAAMLELICWTTLSLGHWLRPDPLRPEVSPAYAGATWVSDFYKQQSLRVESHYTYFAFRVTGVTPWESKYLNSDSHPTGVWRRTVNPEGGRCEEQQKARVWVFGGSTVFGTGAPDWATIPSYLSRSLNRDGSSCFDITNFGVEGFVTTQDVILLTEQLKRGGRPKIVIFYDGVNDAQTGMRAADPWNTFDGLGVIKARAEGSLQGRTDFVRRFHTMQVVDAVRQLFRQRGRPFSAEDLREKAVTVLDNYEANLNIVEALSDAYKFRFYAFWQPMLLYSHKPLVSFEKQITEYDATSGVRVAAQPFVAAYQEAERRALRGRFVYMAGVFDSVTEPVYIDEVHLGPHGNELVADALAK